MEKLLLYQVKIHIHTYARLVKQSRKKKTKRFFVLIAVRKLSLKGKIIGHNFVEIVIENKEKSIDKICTEQKIINLMKDDKYIYISIPNMGMLNI